MNEKTQSLPAQDKSTPKHGVNAEIPRKERFIDIFSPVVGNNTTLNTLAANALTAIKKLENEEARVIKAQEEHTAKCCQHINASMKQGPFIEALRTVAVGDQHNPTHRYAIGIQAVLLPIQAGKPAQISSLIKSASADNEDLSEKFLRSKIQPLLVSHGLLIRETDGTYRWPTHNELCISLPITPSNRIGKLKATSKKALASTTGYIKAAAHNRKLAKAARNPYQRITESGEIIQLRKHYSGELTNEEKAKIRERDKAIKEAKIAKQTEAARAKANKAKARTEQRDAATQYQNINTQADLAIAEKQANRRIQQENLKSWFPIGIAAGVAAAVFLAYQQPDNSAELEIMPASWETAQPSDTESYPLPPESQE